MPHRGLVRGLFALIQVMYLAFYLSALSHMHDVDRVADSFFPGWGADAIVTAVLVTGAIGIPLRFYLISAVSFDFRKLGKNFRRLFPFILHSYWFLTSGLGWLLPHRPRCFTFLFPRERWCEWDMGRHRFSS
jgi:hypothetical protein